MEQCSPQRLLRKHGFRHKRRWGQNFISDKNLLASIVRDAGVTAQDWVFEIGPGLGTLTAALADAAHFVTAVELDRELVAILHERPPAVNCSVVQGDARALEWDSILRRHGWGGQPLKMVANLPYYVTTPLIMRCLEGPPRFQSCTVMVQHEVARRMQAEPGSKDYGILSLMVQYYSSPHLTRVVPPDAFFPRPEVHSAVVHLAIHSQPPVTAAKDELFAVIKQGFSQRRKTFRNAVRPLVQEWELDMGHVDAAMSAAGIDSRVRAEELSLHDFAFLTNALLRYRNDR